MRPFAAARTGPPKRNRPRLTGISSRAGNFIGSSATSNTAPGSGGQTIFEIAGHLDRLADAHLFEGRHAVAERLSHEAAALRQAVLV